MCNKPVARIILFSGFSLLVACSTVSTIPGMDRIRFESSRAEIGPVETESGELVPGSEADSEFGVLQADQVDALVESADQSNTHLPVAVPEQNDTETADSAAGADINANVANIEPASTTTSSDLSSSSESKKLTQTKPSEVREPTDHLAEQKTSSALDKKSAHINQQVNKKQAEERYDLRGKVSLLTNKGEISPKGVIVRVKRADGKPLPRRELNTAHDVGMANKTYLPSSIVIQKGDIVNFINKDQIQHNVFSSTGENAFDLGTFGGGLQRKVRLNKDGVAKVYCNIHPKMATFIAVDDIGQSQVIESEQGDFVFASLPVGEYEITLWSIRGENTTTIELDKNFKEPVMLSLSVEKKAASKHLNKFGKEYQEKNILGEFY